MKKLFAIVIVIAVTVALGVTAFAQTVYTDNDGGIIWDGGFWLSNDTEVPAEHTGRTIDAVINASGAISELGVPNYWASNPATDGQTNAVVHVNVFKFDVNYAKTKQGTPVASGEIELAGDSGVGTTTEAAGTNCKITANGNAGIMLKFDSALPAGQYVVEFSQVSQVEMKHYLVLPMTQKAYPNDTVAYYRNGEKDENFTLRLVVNLDGELLTLIPDGTEPEPAAEITASVNEAGKLVVTATGAFGDKDWIGVYAEGNEPGGDSPSLVWWYVGAEGGTFEVPFDGMQENNRAGLLNEDGTVKEGNYVVYLLANDGYGLVEGTEGIAISVGAEPGTEPATEPATIPQTGDFSVAMFAVIAVLAMGAAVVFMKKKSF